jgi:hypothetical protein
VVVKKLGGMCADIVAVDYENAPYRRQTDEDADPMTSGNLFQRS